MHKSMQFGVHDTLPILSEEDAESRAINIGYGMKNFRIYKVDINNNPTDGEEVMFYYEGVRSTDKSGHEYIDSGERVIAVIDFKRCHMGMGATLNQLGSEKWTRTGIIRYKDSYSIFELQAYVGSKELPSYTALNLRRYTENGKHKYLAPTCRFREPLKFEKAQ